IAISDESRQKIKKISKKIEDVSFQKEEIRKAMQLAVLKGFKHTKTSNQEMTPDTIGILVAYLIKSFRLKKDPLVILDPIVGTANLITTVANQLERNVRLVGVDADNLKCELASIMFDMMDYGEEVFFQDTLTFYNVFADVILADFSYDEVVENRFFPYEVIMHHHSNLSKDGLFFAVIFNDFFENELSASFREEMLAYYDILGLIKLPDTMFKSIGKSILILQNKQNEFDEKQFLLADIPSFEDEDAFKKALNKINQWFDNHQKKLGEK
ncbi:MAG: N-6 DNA methylase, partial [Candidatus Izemoplasmatales bacterium]